MSRMHQLLDIFSPSHRYRDETENWQKTGKLPDYVVRKYKSERVQRADLLRMQALGYRVVKREELCQPGMSGDAADFGGPATTGGIPVGWQISYTRNPFEYVGNGEDSS